MIPTISGVNSMIQRSLEYLKIWRSNLDLRTKPGLQTRNGINQAKLWARTGNIKQKLRNETSKAIHHEIIMECLPPDQLT